MRLNSSKLFVMSVAPSTNAEACARASARQLRDKTKKMSRRCSARRWHFRCPSLHVARPSARPGSGPAAKKLYADFMCLQANFTLTELSNYHQTKRLVSDYRLTTHLTLPLRTKELHGAGKLQSPNRRPSPRKPHRVVRFRQSAAAARRGYSKRERYCGSTRGRSKARRDRRGCRPSRRVSQARATHRVRCARRPLPARAVVAAGMKASGARRAPSNAPQQ
jgi:hypothetical protein